MKHLAKVILYVLVVIMSAYFTGCTSRTSLEQIVMEANDECPYPINNWSTIEKVEYIDNSCIMTIYIGRGLMNIARDDQAAATLHQNLLTGFVNTDDELFSQFFKVMVNEKADFVIKIINNLGDTIVQHFTNKELAAFQPTNNINPDAELMAIANNMKLQLPITIQTGLIATDCILNDTYLIHVYSMDEQIYDMDFFEKYITEMKKSLIQNIDYSDPTIINLINLLKQTKRGLSYKYIGTITGKYFTINIETNEL